MLKGKAIMIISLIIIGSVIAIIRFFKNAQSGSSLSNTLKQLQKNPEKADRYASKLDCFLGRYEHDNPRVLNDLISELETNKRLGKYVIHATHRLMNGSYLIVTQCHDKEYSMNPGGMDMVNEVYQINFLVTYKQSLKQLVIYSHLYANAAEERLLKEFSKDAIKILETKNMQS